MDVSQGLSRFHRAQDQSVSGFADALYELQAGAKRSHWIWYVFPQLFGLGTSDMARTFGLRGVTEAQAYLRDPVLRSRLLAVTLAVDAHLRPPAAKALSSLMGSDMDALKLVSSLTLFEAVARAHSAAKQSDETRALADAATRVLDAAAAQGYPRCRHTFAMTNTNY